MEISEIGHIFLRDTFEESYQQIVGMIAYEYGRHAFLLECPELSEMRDKYEAIKREKAPKAD